MAKRGEHRDVMPVVEDAESRRVAGQALEQLLIGGGLHERHHRYKRTGDCRVTDDYCGRNVAHGSRPLRGGAVWPPSRCCVGRLQRQEARTWW